MHLRFLLQMEACFHYSVLVVFAAEPASEAVGHFAFEARAFLILGWMDAAVVLLDGHDLLASACY